MPPPPPPPPTLRSIIARVDPKGIVSAVLKNTGFVQWMMVGYGCHTCYGLANNVREYRKSERILEECKIRAQRHHELVSKAKRDLGIE